MADLYQKANDWITDRINVALQKLAFNKTIEGIIINDSTKSQNKYLIEYNDLTFYAYTNDNTLKIGDWVYILLPNGDFSAQKIILSKKYGGG